MTKFNSMKKGGSSHAGHKFIKLFYGDEAMQFSYFRIPCQFITHPRFKHLSTDSKLLYSMLPDRMGLSIKNEWYDEFTSIIPWAKSAMT